MTTEVNLGSHILKRVCTGTNKSLTKRQLLNISHLAVDGGETSYLSIDGGGELDGLTLVGVDGFRQRCDHLRGQHRVDKVTRMRVQNKILGLRVQSRTLRMRVQYRIINMYMYKRDTAQF